MILYYGAEPEKYFLGGGKVGPKGKGNSHEIFFDSELNFWYFVH